MPSELGLGILRCPPQKGEVPLGASLAFAALASWAGWPGTSATARMPSRSTEHGPENRLPANDHALPARELSGAMGRGDTVGVVALVTSNDRVLYEGAASELAASHDPAMPVDAIFWIASMAKPLTSVAAKQLVEQRKTRLNDQVSIYLPGFDNLKVITKFNAGDETYKTRPNARLR